MRSRTLGSIRIRTWRDRWVPTTDQRTHADHVGIAVDLMGTAAEQGGYVTRAQLLEMALTESAIDWRVRTGQLTPVTDGVYRVFPSEDHLDLMRGALLALPDAVVSHQSAAHLLGLPRLPRLEPTVTIASHRTHAFPGVMVRRSDDVAPAHITQMDEVPVTTVPRTMFDLGSVLRFREFEALADAAILGGRMNEAQFEQITNELARRGKPGSRAAKDFLATRAGALPGASVLERRGRRLLTSANLPTPVPEFPIPWEIGRRFDDAYPDAKLAIEWDSRAWHLQRAAMEADRRRDRTAAMHGWLVVRVTWQDIEERPREILSTIAELLEQRSPSS